MGSVRIEAKKKGRISRNLDSDPNTGVVLKWVFFFFAKDYSLIP